MSWNVPPPPPGAGPRRPIRGGRVAAGIGIALAAHTLTVAAMLVGIAVDESEFAAGAGFFILLIGQGVVLVACLVVGTVLTVRQEGGIGVGLLIGWAIGIIAAPVVGFGICVWAIESSGL